MTSEMPGVWAKIKPLSLERVQRSIKFLGGLNFSNVILEGLRLFATYIPMSSKVKVTTFALDLLRLLK